MDDIEELVEVIQQWHSRIVAGLQMVADSDDKTEIKLQSVDGKTVIIPEEKVQSFKWGVSVALEHFKKLPFTVNANDFDDDQEG